MGNLINKLIFNPPREDNQYRPTLYINETPCILILKDISNTLIIHSHGNASNIYQMESFYNELSVATGCSVLGYDYKGYGKRSDQGFPTEQEMVDELDDIVNKFVELKFKIILYGTSLGTGPTLSVAMKNNVFHSPILAVILHGAYVSLYRVVLGLDIPFMELIGDMFDNLSNIKKVNKVPILLVHGTDDEIINYGHAHALHEASFGNSELHPLENGSHTDLELKPIISFINNYGSFGAFPHTALTISSLPVPLSISMISAHFTSPN
jgi:fermentation-respiration switch protein FrsA (DUF1100 family)